MPFAKRVLAAAGFVLPWCVLAVALWPLASGRETIYDRDFLNFHYQARYALAEGLSEGYIPLVDRLRGGQPLAGNPNTVVFYPLNVLLLFGVDPLWVLNAQFFVHLLLAPFAMFWLARVWGLGRGSAWAAGIVYATCGWAFSLSNLQNLSAGLPLIPAFAAAVLVGWSGKTRGLLAAGVIWALLLLAGDPMSALLAVVLALSAALARGPWWPARPWRLAAALLCGSLLAAPQLLTLLQILPGSFREHWGYSESVVLATSWFPITSLEWLLPFFFGIADEFSFWGGAFYRIDPPFYFSLYPGLLAFALVACAGLPKQRVDWWAWGSLGAGLFLALGSVNPAAVALIRLSGSVIRYPVKLWPLVAVGAALLVGRGWARTVDAGDHRPLIRILGVFALVYATVASLTLRPSTGLRDWVERSTPARLSGTMLDAELARWSVLCLLTLALLGALVLVAWLGRSRTHVAGPLLLALHAGSQALFLVPAYDTDEAAFYHKAPPLRGLVGQPEGWLTHARNYSLFGPSPPMPMPNWEDMRKFRFERARYAALYPHAGLRSGLGYDFDPSPEGLDSFLTVALARAMSQLDDQRRVRLLAASGVEVLISFAPLDDDAQGTASLLGRGRTDAVPLFAYRLDEAVPPVALLTDLRYAPDVTRSLERFFEIDFDPRVGAVLPGAGPDRRLAPGRVEVTHDAAEVLELDVDAPEGGVVLVQRAYLPMYRATIDGVPATPHAGNIHRIAGDVPPGRHEVRIWVDRRPLRTGFALALVGLIGLLALAVGSRRIRPTSGG